MFQNNVFKGVLFVGLGAISYGVLATFVKMAYLENYTTAEITSSQFILGLLGMIFILRVTKSKNEKNTKASVKNKFQLTLAGTSFGLTSVFYYLAVKYTPVSVCIVLLMQTVWMGFILDWLLNKKKPSFQKTIAAFMVLLGTFFATNLFNEYITIDWRGLTLGLLAAASFTTTMFTANQIAVNIASTQRSMYMLLGGAFIVFAFSCFTQTTPFNYTIFLKWGILLALFGTIIPPILMNEGFPLTGLGLGSIISSLELPVSVLMAYFLLNEQITITQWIGIFIILLGIVVSNANFNKN